MGWIKLHRKLLNNSIFRKPELLQLWIYLLLNACYKPEQHNAQQLQPGQLAVSCETISRALGYPNTSRKSIWRWLKKLEKEGCIRLEASKNNTIITICNWNIYQVDENDSQPCNSSVIVPLPTLNKTATESATQNATQSATQSATAKKPQNQHGSRNCRHASCKSAMQNATREAAQEATPTAAIYKEDIKKIEEDTKKIEEEKKDIYNTATGFSDTQEVGDSLQGFTNKSFSSKETTMRDYTLRFSKYVPNEQLFRSLDSKKQLDKLVSRYVTRFPQQRKKYGAGAAVTARRTFEEAIQKGINPFLLLIQIDYWDEESDGQNPSPWMIVDSLNGVGPWEQTMQYVRYSFDCYAATRGVQVATGSV
ncbi:MAG: hypothetical protein ACPLTR_01925 [Thermacetogeniaceae bacterium]